jgi:hypothetical protein
MNKNEIGEIEDIIGMLGDVNDDAGSCSHWIAEECAEKLFVLIKPYILKDIKKTGDLNHLQVIGDEHL